MSITLPQLEYALAIEKYRHFANAAKACHVTQPTLSQQLHKLEDELGLVLFDRLKKPILPTPEGARFLVQARIVLREHEKLLFFSRQIKEGEVAGEFRLGVIPTVSSYLLPLFLKSFSKEYSKVELLIEEMKTASILDALATDKLDAAILATPLDDESQLKVHPIYYEKFYAYFSKNHRLLSQDKVSRSNLNLEEIWLLQDGHCFKDQILNFCANHNQGIQRVLSNVHFQSGSLDTLRRMVRSNSGFTLLPELMAHALPGEERRMFLREFSAPIPTREISIVYRRDHWKLAIIEALEAQIIKNLPDQIVRKSDRRFKVLEVHSS